MGSNDRRLLGCKSALVVACVALFASAVNAVGEPQPNPDQANAEPGADSRGVPMLKQPNSSFATVKTPFSVTLSPTVRRSGGAELWFTGVAVPPDGGWVYPSSGMGTPNGPRSEIGLDIPSFDRYRITAEVEVFPTSTSCADFYYLYLIPVAGAGAKTSDPTGQKRFECIVRPNGRAVYSTEAVLNPGRHKFIWTFDGLKNLVAFSITNQ